MWSMGVILYILLSGCPPFYAKGKRTTVDHVKTGSYNMELRAFKTVSDEAKDLIKKLLVMDPEDRLTPEQALDHIWLKS